MSYVYCTYLSFSDVVAPIGADFHRVGEGRFFLVSTSRICELLATVITVTVGPAVLWGTQVQWLGTSMAPTSSTSASASVVASITWSVGESYGLDLG